MPLPISSSTSGITSSCKDLLEVPLLFSRAATFFSLPFTWIESIHNKRDFATTPHHIFFSQAVVFNYNLHTPTTTSF